MCQQKNTNHRKKANAWRKGLYKICSISLSVMLLVIFYCCCERVLYRHIANPASTETTSYYKSIEVKQGDTLWEIAKNYTDDNHDSIRKYVKLIKDINGLQDDAIHADRYLTVIYSPETL